MVDGREKGWVALAGQHVGPGEHVNFVGFSHAHDYQESR